MFNLHLQFTNNYVSWIPVGKITVKPTVYASYIFVPTPTKLRIDTFRKVNTENEKSVDTLRDVVSENFINGDILRKIQKSENINSDSKRKITNSNTLSADTKRDVFIPNGGWVKPKNYISWIPTGKITVKPQIYASYMQIDHVVAVHGDLLRQVSAMADTFADTKREVQHIEYANADTRRTVGSSVVDGDTSRNIGVACIVGGDLSRQIKYSNNTLGDTSRTTLGIVSATFDTSRLLGIGNTAIADTSRKIRKLQRAHGDTILRVPLILEYAEKAQRRLLSKNITRANNSITTSFREHGIRSLNISLNELTLSDTFQIETVMPMEIEQAVQGQFLDFPLNFLVEETNQQNLLQTVKGMYSVDKQLYMKLWLYFGERDTVSASYYALLVANALGLTLNYRADDFIPSQNFSSGTTYSDIISSVFGWTSRLPHRQINVFIRGNTLNFLQRGAENAVIDISSFPHSQPIINRKLVRTIWSSSGNDTDKAHNEETTEPIPFTGRIGIDGVYRYYEGGYLVREDNDKSITRYSYSGGYLVEKNTTNEDKSTVRTNYIYAVTERDIYLCKEVETTYTPKEDEPPTYNEDDENKSERITYHAPVGYGWYSTSVYVDGEFEGSSLSQGKPGGKASQFLIDESNLSLGSHRVTYGGGMPYSSLIDTEFPVKGDDYLAMLTGEIEWLNRKREETVTVDIISNVTNGVPEIQHIIDFTERIKFNGNEYFLVSNNVSFTPRTFRQKLQLVRWYA